MRGGKGAREFCSLNNLHYFKSTPPRLDKGSDSLPRQMCETFTHTHTHVTINHMKLRGRENNNNNVRIVECTITET